MPSTNLEIRKYINKELRKKKISEKGLFYSIYFNKICFAITTLSFTLVKKLDNVCVFTRKSHTILVAISQIMLCFSE